MCVGTRENRQKEKTSTEEQLSATMRRSRFASLVFMDERHRHAAFAGERFRTPSWPELLDDRLRSALRQPLQLLVEPMNCPRPATMRRTLLAHMLPPSVVDDVDGHERGDSMVSEKLRLAEGASLPEQFHRGSDDALPGVLRSFSCRASSKIIR
jgi:hypothetical protein